MASSISYGMGQIRYINGTNYLSNLSFAPYPIETISVSGTKNYQDIVLYGSDLNNYFSSNKSYYLRIGIPRNLSYDMTFDLKLLKGSITDNVFSFDNRNQYQEIKRFVVARDSSKAVAYSRVILYPDGGQNRTENPVVAIAIEDPDNISSLTQGTVYYLSSTDQYFIKQNNNTDIEIKYRNDILLNHTWVENQTDDIVYYDFVFSNKVTGENFNSVLLELNRNSYDDDVQWIDEDGKEYNGLHLDISKLSVECYEIFNMIDNINFSTKDIKSFSNIGVWSHPDAIMSINGEEIRIGQSGYYELNDFNITNFGIVVRGPQDRFSIDYQYAIT